MNAITQELASQPDCWERAAKVAQGHLKLLPPPGERVAVIGCGTSYYMAASYAVAREMAGEGQTDVFAASQFLTPRTHDVVVAISRSGTTTEVFEAIERQSRTRTLLITAGPGSPIAEVADDEIALGFADERSVVQTRFATSALTLLLTSCRIDTTSAVEDARRALETSLDQDALDAEQFVFLGDGWAKGLADEAALKLREAAGAWTESYFTMEYRHGPITLATPQTTVFALSALDPCLKKDIQGTDACIVEHEIHPMARLVVAQRMAVELASQKGLDPDHPRNLTRSVVLSD
jgi:fructoselysine-6-P-deglycase FrlB-like protein